MLRLSCISYYSYIKPQHPILCLETSSSCISYYSYIKPQPAVRPLSVHGVVYRTIPTSNHNVTLITLVRFLLYIVLFLHQTTTQTEFGLVGDVLYIVLFLHQTTTYCLAVLVCRGCISYYSYIKPQRYYMGRI